jgi:hypothetical protein
MLDKVSRGIYIYFLQLWNLCLYLLLIVEESQVPPAAENFMSQMREQYYSGFYCVVFFKVQCVHIAKYEDQNMLFRISESHKLWGHF